MEDQLVLVGVVHRDPKGKPLLLELLETLHPSAISVEISPYGLIWRERHSHRCLEMLEEALQGLPPSKRHHHEIQLIRTALAIPYEFSASIEHALLHGTPVFFSDLNGPSRRFLNAVERELLTKENIDKLVDQQPMDLNEVISREYSRARLCLREPSLARTYLNHLDPRREGFIACRVRRFYEYFGRLVHVGGWLHLLEDPHGRTLWAMLKGLSPKRLLLGDAPLFSSQGGARAIPQNSVDHG